MRPLANSSAGVAAAVAVGAGVAAFEVAVFVGAVPHAAATKTETITMARLVDLILFKGKLLA